MRLCNDMALCTRNGKGPTMTGAWSLQSTLALLDLSSAFEPRPMPGRAAVDKHSDLD